VSLKNNLNSGIRAAVLVVFHDASGALVDMSVVSYDDIIPARMAKRVYGEVDPQHEATYDAKLLQ
jgi:hypothetical protein